MSLVLCQEIRDVCLLFSDISFLCEATTSIVAQEQQHKLSVQHRASDKSAVRAMPNELQEAVCPIFI